MNALKDLHGALLHARAGSFKRLCSVNQAFRNSLRIVDAFLPVLLFFLLFRCISGVFENSTKLIFPCHSCTYVLNVGSFLFGILYLLQ